MSSIRLYIGGSEVDLNTAPGINYNWAETDFTNPTVTKIGYSKTITLPGTKNNSKIFGHFWDLTRLQRYDGQYTGVDFNPTSKVPFTLTWNGVVLEEGYVKLQKVNNEDGLISYEVGLFGGLGSFLSNLSTRYDDGNPKTLGDLQFYLNGSETDLGFTISKETVNTAWSNIDNSESIYSIINFAPGYTGVPDKMDADKVLINFNGINNDVIPSSYTEDNETYLPYNGYAIAKLENKIDGWAAKDLRSYLQTPVIRVKSIFDALQHPINSKGSSDSGYDVILDENFFNDGNPYYEDAWMTLPKITTLTYNYGSGETETVTSYTQSQNTYYNNSKGDVVYTTTLDFTLSEVVDKGGVKANIDFDLYNTVTSGSTAPTAPLYLQSNYWNYGTRGGMYYTAANRTALAAQLIAYDADGNILRGSDINWYTSLNYDGQYFSYYDADYTPLYPSTPVQMLGAVFSHVTSFGRYSVYKLLNGIKLEFDVPVGTAVVKLNIQRIPQGGGSTTAYGNTLSTGIQAAYIPPATVRGNYSSQSSGVLTVSSFNMDTTDFFSYKYIDQKMLMSTDYSVADWLMSYCKMMGLYIHKDVVENKVYIDTRGTFYQKQKINNIQEYIDRSKKFEIKPVKTESKYYSLTNPIQENEYSKGYKSNYGYEYGEKVIDTGYDFDPGVKELLDKCKFKTAIPINKPSVYNYKVKNGINPYVYNGFSYDLYKSGYVTGTTESITVKELNISAMYKDYELNSDAPGFDAYYKMYWENDGKGIENKDILLFYNGKKDVTGCGYWLTDDTGYMGSLNEKPCWIMTDSATGIGGEIIAVAVSSIPDFSIYHTTSDHMVDASMNMGSPREVYTLPGEVELTESVTLYNQYYKRYFEDIYDVNTKVVTCYVLPKTILNENNLREFYYFDNSIWALNKIYDYNPSERDVVKMEFIKVQDVDNYCFQIKYPTISLIDLEFHEKEKIVPTISINPSSTTVSVFGNITLSASTNSDAGYFLWEVDDNTIATVANGVVTGVHSGTTTVTVIVPATANYTSASTTCTVSVIAAVPVLSIVPASPVVGYGQHMTISASTNSSSNSFVWTSSDPGVATVTASGKSVTLSGVTTGSTTITVSMAAVDGIWEAATASTTVTVSELQDPSISEIDLYLEERSYMIYHVGNRTRPIYLATGSESDNYLKFYKEDGTALPSSNPSAAYFGSNGDYKIWIDYVGSSTDGFMYFHSGDTYNYPKEIYVGSIQSATGNTISKVLSIIGPTAVTVSDTVEYIYDLGNSLTSSRPTKVKSFVGNGVIEVGMNCFYGCTSLTSCTIPNVETIRYKAFSGCTSLTTISLPNIRTIEDEAFKGCTNLTSVTLSDSLTSIGNSAFANTGIYSITIPTGVTSISSYSFGGCTNLSGVTIPSGVTIIDGAAFSGCTSMTEVTMGQSVTSIGYSAFYDTKISEIVIPSGVTRIGSNAFYNTNLTEVIIPRNVTSIGGGAFYNTILTKVASRPTQPPSLGSNVFNSSKLSSINVPTDSCTAYKASSSDWYQYRNIITCGERRNVKLYITQEPTVTMNCSSQNDDVLIYFTIGQNEHIIFDDDATYAYYFNAGHLEGGAYVDGPQMTVMIDTFDSIELTVIASSSTSGPASHSSGTEIKTVIVPQGTTTTDDILISFSKTFDYSC